MTFETAWPLFLKVVVPVILAYNAWLHNKLSAIEARAEKDRHLFYDYKEHIATTYVAKEALREMESRISQQILRLDTKLDRIIEKESH